MTLFLAIVVVLLGPPGSGKTQQARRVAEAYQIPFISTADLLRDESDIGTRAGRAIAPYLYRGELVPDSFVNPLLSRRIRQLDCARGFALDGYPRTTAQASFLSQLLVELHLPSPLVFYLDAPDEMLFARLGIRSRPRDEPRGIWRRIETGRADATRMVAKFRAPASHVIRTDIAADEVLDRIQRIIEVAIDAEEPREPDSP